MTILEDRSVEEPDASAAPPSTPTPNPQRGSDTSHARDIVILLLSLCSFATAGVAGYFKWEAESSRLDEIARIDAVVAASDATKQMLSYTPDTAEQTLTGAAALTTGEFNRQYSSLIRDVVIPGARARHIVSLAQVVSAAAVSSTAEHVEVVLFVNQSVTVGSQPATQSAVTVRAVLDQVNGHWLVSSFEPVT